MRTEQGNVETTLCLLKRNRSSVSGVVRWRGSPVPFDAFITFHLQDLEIPEARWKLYKRKLMRATAGECGHISPMKIRECSLFCNGDGIVPEPITCFA